MSDRPLESLERAPIVEAVCGFLFDSIPQIDPFSLSKYIDSKQGLFPRHEFHAAIASQVPPGHFQVQIGLGGSPDVGPIRTWLLSPKDDFLLQIQHDRFYVNWRKGTGETAYPRFSAPTKGLVDRAISDYEDFALFCEQQFGKRPALRQLEVTKLDHLVPGRDWNGPEDLGRMLPAFAALLRGSRSQVPAVSLRLLDQSANNTIAVSVEWAPTMQAEQQMLKVETTIRMESPRGEAALIRSAFLEANTRANEMFLKLIPLDEIDRRFNGKNGGHA